MARSLLCVGTLFAVLAGAPLVALLGFIYSLFRYTGFEVVVIGILIDGYTGAFFEVPYLTIGSFLLWITVDALKQALLLYTKNDAIIS